MLKGVKAEFYAASSREPDVYRGRPFQIEAAIAFGGELARRRHRPRDSLRQPRAAAVPAIRVQQLQSGQRNRLAKLQPQPTARLAFPSGRWSS